MSVEANKIEIFDDHSKITQDLRLIRESQNISGCNNAQRYDYDTPSNCNDAVKNLCCEVTKENNLPSSNITTNLIDKTEARKSILQRYFSSIEEGSLRGSIFNMTSLALGTGCLTMPLQFNQMSIFGGMMVMIFASLATIWSLNILILSSLKFDVYDFSKVVKKIFGSKAALILDLTILIYIFGIMISYQVVINQIIGDVICSIFFSNCDSFKENWKKAEIHYPIMFIMCALLIPLCYVQNIAKMRFMSLFAICSILYTIIIVVFEFPFYLKDNLNKKNCTINWYDITPGFSEKLYSFQGASVFFFVYTIHIGVFPVYKAIKHNKANETKDIYIKMQKIIIRSVLFDAFIFALIGICGYLTIYCEITPPTLIINRHILFKNDAAMIIGKIFFCITLILNLPANYNAFRISLLEQIFGNTDVTNKRNLLITIPALLLSCLIASLNDNFLNYINILGGFASVIISFIFPGLLYIKTNEIPLSHWKNITSIILVSILVLIGFTSCIVTILNLK